MTTVLEDYITEVQSSVMRFLRAKGHNAKNFCKEIYPVYSGKCFSRKAIHNWVETFSQGRSKVADDARPGAEVAETTFKRLTRCAGKTMGQVYNT
jgi:hypothetical protein